MTQIGELEAIKHAGCDVSIKRHVKARSNFEAKAKEEDMSNAMLVLVEALKSETLLGASSDLVQEEDGESIEKALSDEAIIVIEPLKIDILT